MKNFVIINGVNSNTKNGLGINELPPITKPSMRTQTEEIDGRDGDIITKLGYSAYDKTITIGLFGTGYDVNDIISFFTSEGTITFSNEPDKYYKFTMLEQIDVESLLRFKTASITFHCQPFKYPLTETPLEIEYDYIEQTGETLTLNNTGESILELSLKGNTSQYTTTGKNLFKQFQTQTINNLTLTANEDGSITLNGTPSSSFNFALTNISLKAGYNSLQCKYVGTLLNDSNSRCQVWSPSTGFALDIKNSDNNTIVISRELENDVNDIQLRIRAEGGFNYQNVKLYPMLVKGNYTSETIGDFEPYTNGTSPNPSYPQEIHSVTGDNEVVVCGKNMLNPFVNYSAGYTTTINGITFTINEDGSIKANGTATAKATLVLYGSWSGTQVYQKLDSSKQYCLKQITPNNRFIFLRTYDNGTYTTYNSDTQRIITGKSNLVYFGVEVSSGTTLDNYVFYPMLNDGTTPADFEPYQSQTYPINLGELELCKIGDYQDYFTKNSGKNLFDKDNANVIDAYLTNNTQATILSNGPTNKGIWISAKPNTTYTISRETSSTNRRFGVGSTILEPAVNVALTTAIVNNNSSSITITTGANDNYLFVYIWTQNSSLTLNEICSSIMINEGSTPQPYEPYGTGQWCKYNAIGKYVFIGASVEGWGDNGSQALTNTIYLYSRVLDYQILNVDNQPFYSTRFVSKSLWGVDEEGMELLRAPTQIRARISKTLATTPNEFKTWLSTHNTTLYYILASPYLSLIEDTTLISQLDNIQNAMSYEGQTNVSQVNDDKPFIISAKALEQGSDEVTVNNIGNIYSKPLIALEGNGIVNIYLNDNQVLQANVEDKMNIDIDTLEAYNPDTSVLLNRQVTGNYNSMTIPSGESIIKIDGALDKATITNYQRWL